jgi:hypothetical protein
MKGRWNWRRGTCNLLRVPLPSSFWAEVDSRAGHFCVAFSCEVLTHIRSSTPLSKQSKGWRQVKTYNLLVGPLPSSFWAEVDSRAVQFYVAFSCEVLIQPRSSTPWSKQSKGLRRVEKISQ